MANENVHVMQQPKPEVIQLAPPPYVVRARAGLGVPTAPASLMQAVAGAVGGAAASALFIGAFSGNARFVSAMITGALGVMFAATSPLGTIPSEVGMGMFSTSASYMYFTLFHQTT